MVFGCALVLMAGLATRAAAMVTEDSGLAALDKARNSLSSWYVDVMRGTVVVEVVRGEPEGVNWARRFGLVDVRTVGQPPRPVWNLAAGDGSSSATTSARPGSTPTRAASGT